MGLTVYPAHLEGLEFVPADIIDGLESGWDVGGLDFMRYMRENLGIHLRADPGHMKTKTLAFGLRSKYRDHPYDEQVKRILAIAAIYKAEYIVYA